MRKIKRKYLDLTGHEVHYVIVSSFNYKDVKGYFDSYAEAERELLEAVNSSDMGILYEIAEVIE